MSGMHQRANRCRQPIREARFTRRFANGLSRRLHLDLLGERDFGGFMLGQAVYTLGMVVFMTTNRWLIYDLSGSDALLGARGLIAGAVLLLIGPFCGVLGDRYGRLPVLRTSALAQAILAVLLAAGVFAGWVEAWHLLVVVALNTTAHAAIGPATKGLLPRLAGEERTPSALALNAISFELNRAIGPALAGLLIAAAGAPAGFLLLPAACLFFRWRLRRVPRRFATKPTAVEPFWRQWSTGLQLARTAGLFPVFTVVIFGSVARAAVLELLPSLASLRFGGEAEAYGFLMSGFGAGALAGSIFLLSRQGKPKLPQAGIFQIAMALCVVGLGSSAVFTLSMALVTACGFAFMVSALQLETLALTGMPDDRRSLISSAFGMVNLGTMSFAAFSGGLFAEVFGMPATFVVMGAASILGIAFSRGFKKR